MNRREELAENLATVKSELPAHVKLIVVTKTFPASDVKILKDLGVEDFGENRDQEGSAKAEKISATWHFQGQLQSNKLKSICSWADVIHSVDSLRYVDLISKATSKKLSLFIQVSIDNAEGRGGANLNSLTEIADAILLSEKLTLLGLMAVAPLGVEPNLAFEKLAKIHQNFRSLYPGAKYLSAGMSADYKAAISHGATHIRIGSSILGSRPQIR